MEVNLESGEYVLLRVGDIKTGGPFEFDGEAFVATDGFDAFTRNCLSFSDGAIQRFKLELEVRLLELVAPIKLRRVRK